MNILILLKSFNYPPRNGGDQAVFNAIACMASQVHYHLISTDASESGKRSVAAFSNDFPQIPTQIYDLNKVNKYQFISNKLQRISNFINNCNGNRQEVQMRLLGGYETNLDYYHHFYQFLNNYINENQIDIIQSEFTFTIAWLKGIVGTVKKVFIHHEIQFVVNQQRLLQREHTKEDMYYYQQERQQEINALNCCDAIITLSENDRQKLIENGVHTPVFASFAQIRLQNMNINYPVEIKKQLVFIGPETHEPNRQGLQWFLDQVWPLIKVSEPEITLTIIGRWSEGTINLWQQQYLDIKFPGFVENLHTAIANSILIVPLFQGSGVRMKILEACNIGIPFVSTTIGAEGLGFTDAENCFISDDIQELASKCLLLIGDNTLANLFIERSIKHIREEFNDERFIDSRMKCFEFLKNKVRK